MRLLKRTTYLLGQIHFSTPLTLQKYFPLVIIHYES